MLKTNISPFKNWKFQTWCFKSNFLKIIAEPKRIWKSHFETKCVISDSTMKAHKTHLDRQRDSRTITLRLLKLDIAASIIWILETIYLKVCLSQWLVALFTFRFLKLFCVHKNMAELDLSKNAVSNLFQKSRSS